MSWWTLGYAARRTRSALRRLRGGLIFHPLGDAGDSEIDAELEKSGLTRSDIFTAGGAVARHRIRMAHMLAAWQIDVPHATECFWTELKTADTTCSLCRNAERCQRWLEYGLANAAPLVFCANADLFVRIARAQADTAAGDGVTSQESGRDLSTRSSSSGPGA